MQMQTASLETMLRYEKPRPHELYQFFRSRNIQNRAIAKSLNVSEVAIQGWLSGRIPITNQREQQLQDLKRAILRWEYTKGRYFDARDYEVK